MVYHSYKKQQKTPLGIPDGVQGTMRAQWPDAAIRRPDLCCAQGNARRLPPHFEDRL